MKNFIAYIINSLIIISLSGLWFVASNAIAAEDYYTWVDENGVTNYAQRNPQGYEARFITKSHRFGERQTAPAIKIPAKPMIPDTPNGKTVVDPDAIIADERKKLVAQLAVTKRSNCKIGKRNLARLQMFSRVRVTDDKGESRTLTDIEKQAKEATARKIIQDNCTG